ncbi:MAG: aminotransferase class I/II-fold pyridoxal phosphate-dependent enzyme [Ruminococcaceae bacterium]|nr:aminotransferase class I/II-fold pyridoxal phosphate-dependent enzyme [Oscillospiraceae bacterium]
MLSFASDYLEGAHETILRRLTETNREQLPGYGSDPYCESAAAKIRATCEAANADVHFLVGGTQTNQIVITALLHEGEGVIAADTGHIATHEAGAIEATGHKVLTLPHHQGKVSADDLNAYLKAFNADANHEHMVLPAMLYLSHPTEYGTLYRKEELTALAAVCRQHQIPLFLDGARLGYGLMSDDTDLTLPDIAALCDVFYIGGTKVGALCGEAVVFPRGNAPKRFLTTIKRHGALLAKGRLLGIQFDTLFTDRLYFRIARHAIVMADKLKNIFREKGYTFYLESPTNQLFIVLDRETRERLSKQVNFSFWETLDNTHTVVRFATSWATTEEEIEALASLL